MKKHQNRFEKSQKSKKLIQFKTQHPRDCFAINGIVLKYNPKIVVLAKYQFLEFNGFIILPKKNIKASRDSKFEECKNKIIRYNTSIRHASIPEYLKRCKDMQDIFQNLKKARVWPFVDVVYEDRTFEGYMGKIVEVLKTGIVMENYDASGKWDKFETEIDFVNIFSVEFHTKYCKNFNRYMRRKK